MFLNFDLRAGKGLHVVLKEKMAASEGMAVIDVLRANLADEPGFQLFIVAIEEKVLEWNECREERRRDEFSRCLALASTIEPRYNAVEPSKN